MAQTTTTKGEKGNTNITNSPGHETHVASGTTINKGEGRNTDEVELSKKLSLETPPLQKNSV